MKHRTTKVSAGKSEDGFTLIEVLVAMAILTIGVLAVFAMQTNAMLRSNNALKSNQAGFWVQDKVEDLMRLPYNDAQLDSINNGGVVNNTLEGPYTVSWAVFSDAENGSSINTLGLGADPMFASVDRAQNLANLRPNTKFVMVHASHPLGEQSRILFIKPNI